MSRPNLASNLGLGPNFKFGRQIWSIFKFCTRAYQLICFNGSACCTSVLQCPSAIETSLTLLVGVHCLRKVSTEHLMCGI
jgi:hypothetical protein